MGFDAAAAWMSATWAALEELDGSSWRVALSFASIPVVASLIGYGTNVLAIQMTFLPLEYVGCYERMFRLTGFSLGWQGIIPANGVKIAEKAVTIITTRLVTVAEVFGQLDRDRIVEITRAPLLKSIERVLDRVAGDHAPDVWESMSLSARHEFALKACEEAEPYIGAIFDELRADVSLYLDLHALAVEKLTEDKALMNEVFKRCGEEEVMAAMWTVCAHACRPSFRARLDIVCTCENPRRVPVLAVRACWCLPL